MKTVALILVFLFPFVHPSNSQKRRKQENNALMGIASFYHKKFEGKKTASGEVFSNSKFTAAHKSLPFGTFVKVTHLKNGKEVEVKINDRLPPKSSRMIDLSLAAANHLEMVRAGLAKVKIELVENQIEVVNDGVED